jgi:hypothetical protein
LSKASKFLLAQSVWRPQLRFHSTGELVAAAVASQFGTAFNVHTKLAVNCLSKASELLLARSAWSPQLDGLSSTMTEFQLVIRNLEFSTPARLVSCGEAFCRVRHVPKVNVNGPAATSARNFGNLA